MKGLITNEGLGQNGAYLRRLLSFGRFRHENANRLSLRGSWAAEAFSQGDARPSLALGFLLVGPSVLLKALK